MPIFRKKMGKEEKEMFHRKFMIVSVELREEAGLDGKFASWISHQCTAHCTSRQESNVSAGCCLRSMAGTLLKPHFHGPIRP